MDTEQPVTLVPNRQEEWAHRFAETAANIRRVVPDAVVEHIGSTAVPGLAAKDVVDLLVGVPATEVVPVARQLATSGFDLEGEHDHHCWLSSPDRRRRTVVVHVVEYGSRPWARRMAFRDLLRRDEAARRDYLEVKQRAAAASRDWDEYTRAKDDVVRTLLARCCDTSAGETPERG